MRIKKIGPLALMLTLVTGFLNLDAGRMPGGPRFRASDPRSHSKAGRSQITKERINEAVKRNVIIKSIGSILYAHIDKSEKMKQIKEMVSMFDMTASQLQQYQKTQEKKAMELIKESAEQEKKVKEAQKKLEEIEKGGYSSLEEKNKALKKAKEELVKANAQWSTTKKVMAGLTAVTLVSGGALVIAGGITGLGTVGAAYAVGSGISTAAATAGGATMAAISTAMSWLPWISKGKAAVDTAQQLLNTGEPKKTVTPPTPTSTPTSTPAPTPVPTVQAQVPQASASKGQMPTPPQPPVQKEETPPTTRGRYDPRRLFGL